MGSDSADHSLIGRYQRSIVGVLITIILLDVGIMIYRKIDRAKYSIERERMNFVFRFDPNTAGVQELEAVPGLNQKLAQAIIDYRQEYQRYYPDRLAFVQAADLTQVKGISEKTISKAREFLFFSERTQTHRSNSEVK